MQSMKFFRLLMLVGLMLAACRPLQTPVPTVVPTIAIPTAQPTQVAPTQPPPTATTAAPTAEPTATEESATKPVELSGAPLEKLATGTELTVSFIKMQTVSTGWAVGEAKDGSDDRILHTGTGGATWREITPAQPQDSAAEIGQGATLFALDEQMAWVTYYNRTGGPLSNPAFVWRTADGGATWQTSAELDTTDLEIFQPSDLIFIDAQHGWLMVHAGVGMSHDYVAIYRTADGGATWERLIDPYMDGESGVLPMSCEKTGLLFTDVNNGWVTGNCGGVVPGAPYLQRTTDGGQTWEAVELPAPADAPQLFAQDTSACGVQAAAYFDVQEGLLPVTCLDFNNSLYTSFLYKTLDAGQTWEVETLPGEYKSAAFISPATGFVMVAPNPEGPRELYQTADSAATLNKTKSLNWTGKFSFVSAQAGWAVATSDEGKALVQTTDGGQTWKVLTPVVE